MTPPLFIMETMLEFPSSLSWLCCLGCSLDCQEIVGEAEENN